MLRADSWKTTNAINFIKIQRAQASHHTSTNRRTFSYKFLWIACDDVREIHDKFALHAETKVANIFRRHRKTPAGTASLCLFALHRSLKSSSSKSAQNANLLLFSIPLE